MGFPAGWTCEALQPSPQRQMVVLHGNIEALASGGGVGSVGPGWVSLMEDTWRRGHGGRVVGDGAALVFAVALEDLR